jgi:peptidoglycan hydrolase-like protein with peptidoglycan-binding domain
MGMSVGWFRCALALFCGLTIVLAGNLMIGQPISGRASLMQSAPAQISGTLTNEDAVGQPSDGGRLHVAAPIVTSALEPSSLGSRTSASGLVELTRAIQRELQARGYEAGASDGVAGIVTRAAIMAFETDHGLALTGEASERLLQVILLGTTDSDVKSAEGPGPRAAEVIRTVQTSLAKLGYPVGKPDGRLNESTVRAIREFEAQQGLNDSGRISGQLVARLVRMTGRT